MVKLLPEGTDDIEAKKLQKKFALITGYICMIMLALALSFGLYVSRNYDPDSFKKMVIQLNQLSADAEKASGS